MYTRFDDSRPHGQIEMELKAEIDEKNDSHWCMKYWSGS